MLKRGIYIISHEQSEYIAFASKHIAQNASMDAETSALADSTHVTACIQYIREGVLVIVERLFSDF